MKLPLIAIVGRPNVGKSTLFNRLVGSRRAIVGDEPGITRDRLYGEAHWCGQDFRVVDTGGIIPEEKDFIPAEIFRQARVALEQAAAVVMVVDGRSELAAPDLELARLLQRTGKRLFLAVNKVDSEKQETLVDDFYRLGIREIYPVSAEHGRGVDELLDGVTAALAAQKPLTAEGAESREGPTELKSPPLPKADKDGAPENPLTTEGTEEKTESKSPPLPKAGKDGAPKNPLTTEGTEDTEEKTESKSPPSRKKREKGGAPSEFSFPDGQESTNENREHSTDDQQAETDDQALADDTRPPSHGAVAESQEIKVAIIGHPNVGKSTLLNRLTGTERAIVSPIPGTTRDAVDEVVQRDGKQFRFIDTAGIRRKGKTHLMAEKLSVVMARKHLEAADVALLVIDATEGVSALDASIAGYAHESGRSVIVVVNKWDLCRAGASARQADSRTSASAPHGRRPHKELPRDRTAYEQRLRYALKFLSYAPVLFISAASGKGTEKIFPVLEGVAAERRKRITTGEMNRFLKHIDFERAPVPMRQRVKILYMTQAAVAPPTFVLFTDRKVKLHFSFERFLENQIRRAFGFLGTPIWIKVRARE